MTFKIKDVYQLCKGALEGITLDSWKAAIKHVKDIEEEYWRSDGLVDEIDPVIISLNDSSDSDCEAE